MSASPARDGREAEHTSIWFLITALCIGGAEQTLVDLVNGLDRDRYEVTVWLNYVDALVVANEAVSSRLTHLRP